MIGTEEREVRKVNQTGRRWSNRSGRILFRILSRALQVLKTLTVVGRFSVMQCQRRTWHVLRRQLHPDVSRADLLQAPVQDTKSQFRPITIRAQMAEIQMPQLGGDNLFRCFRRGVIGQMTMPAENPLLDAPGTPRVFPQ